MTEAVTETVTTEAASDSQPNPDVARLNAALAKERELRKEAERKAKDGQTAQQKLEEIEQASASEMERAIAKAVKDATTAERERSAKILAAAEARAQAAGRFENPATVVRLLDLTGVSVSDDGEVDPAGVTSLLDALATSDPYLLKKTEAPLPTPGQAGIGVTGGGLSPSNPRAADIAQIEADLAATKRR